MTYPQPPSVKPVTDGQQFFRITTEIVSSGDIYESEVSALGIALGPNSDIARALVTYYDPDQSNTYVSQAVISPDRNFAGLVNAVNTEDYPSTFTQSHPRKGRILYSIDDLWSDRFRATAFASGDSIQFLPPILDVIQYFKNLPSVVPPRSDRTFMFQYFQTPTGPGTSAWIQIPAFGRKSGYFTFQNLDGAAAVTVHVFGVKFQPTSLGTPAGGFTKDLHDHVTPAAGTDTYIFKSSVDGLWDAFLIQLDGYLGAAMPINVSLSDDIL